MVGVTHSCGAGAPPLRILANTTESVPNMPTVHYVAKLKDHSLTPERSVEPGSRPSAAPLHVSKFHCHRGPATVEFDGRVVADSAIRALNKCAVKLGEDGTGRIADPKNREATVCPWPSTPHHVLINHVA